LRKPTDDDLWLVQADPNHLSQVLLNLCLNARDAVYPLLDAASIRTPAIHLGTGNIVFGPEDLHEHCCRDNVIIASGVALAPREPSRSADATPLAQCAFSGR
jgi:hypothetical protein